MLNTKNKNKGQVLVLVALSLVVFIGFAALAIDVAYFYHTRHQLQGAADAAALAGAAMLTCKSIDGTSQLLARQEAWKFACKNKAVGEKVYLDTNSDLSDCNTPPDDVSDLDNGDILIGYWAGSFSETVPSGRAANAVQVRAHRTAGSEGYGMGAISTFFGRIFNVTQVNVAATAVAKGCFPNISPIAVNEYWLGDKKISTNTNPTSCANPRNPDNPLNPVRVPYGIHHVYPNSFVRPPCNNYFKGDNVAGNKCVSPSPSEGNVDPFPTQSCDPPGPQPSQLVTVSPNGPLPLTSPCSGANCAGRPTTTSGRVFAAVGGAAFPNEGNNMYSLLDLNHRIGCSKPLETPCTENQWYRVSESTFTAVPNADPNPDKNVVAGYIEAGRYPNVPPSSVEEVYQDDYINEIAYPSPCGSESTPCASTSFFSGQGVAGQMVKSNFSPNPKYAPGEQINVVVYDGFVGGGGSGQQRTTIVGYATITIFGYGKEILLDANGVPSLTPPTGNPNEMTMYGYVASIEDSLKRNFEDLPEPFIEGFSTLVQ